MQRRRAYHRRKRRVRHFIKPNLELCLPPLVEEWRPVDRAFYIASKLLAGQEIRTRDMAIRLKVRRQTILGLLRAIPLPIAISGHGRWKLAQFIGGFKAMVSEGTVEYERVRQQWISEGHPRTVTMGGFVYRISRENRSLTIIKNECSNFDSAYGSSTVRQGDRQSVDPKIGK